jgi:hypothetical protein
MTRCHIKRAPNLDSYFLPDKSLGELLGPAENPLDEVPAGAPKEYWAAVVKPGRTAV